MARRLSILLCIFLNILDCLRLRSRIFLSKDYLYIKIGQLNFNTICGNEQKWASHRLKAINATYLLIFLLLGRNWGSSMVGSVSFASFLKDDDYSEMAQLLSSFWDFWPQKPFPFLCLSILEPFLVFYLEPLTRS